MKSALVLIIILLISGCVTRQQPVQLQSVEVREYQGEKLSSVDDLRENSIRGPQYVDMRNYGLKINGLVENPLELKYDEVLEDYRSYSKVVRLDCVEGWSVNILWEGALVRDLLEDAKPLPEANTVIFYAYDGYSTSFPLEYFHDNEIIMAYRMNNITIPPERGHPFMLVAESKWGYKWIKWITRIELSDNPDYEGYWESRGYSDSGDRDKSFLD
ncbi:MAG: molybdopterin-dependent oxidoreductase [Candidatus Altiarchaeota archaeon]